MSRPVVHAAVAAACLVAVVVVASVTDIDVRAADALFAAGGWSWPLPHSGWPRWLAYDGAKLAIIVLGLFLAAGVTKQGLLRWTGLTRREAGYLLTCLCLVPIVIALIKYHSGVSCANALVRYGGETPDALGHFAPSRMVSFGLSQGCWPSGHASGGFALLALGYLPRLPGTQRLLWCIGLAVGGTMGAYQILRGAHFPSHVIVTAAMSQLIVCVFAEVILPGRGMGAWPAARNPDSSGSH